jgi:hypothetical protein
VTISPFRVRRWSFAAVRRARRRCHRVPRVRA